MKGTVILSHGLESGPAASKVSALAAVAEAQGWASRRPDYREIDRSRDAAAVEARVAALLAQVPAAETVVLAGSSMGAYVSGLASLRRAPRGLFLMALPVGLPGMPVPFAAAEVPTALVHGWRDELCPLAPVIEFARARRALLHVVDDEHRLAAHVEFCAEQFGRFLAGLA